jgi:hypothetical protein
MRYEGTFLNDWTPIRRSLITNQFCNAVRSGCKTPPAVVEWVRTDATFRVKERGYDPVQGQEKLLSVVDEPEALEFARFIIKRENLPMIDRQKEKEERSEFFRREYMKTQEPTDKQLTYLSGLGCDVKPQNRLEASDLIDEYESRKTA